MGNRYEQAANAYGWARQLDGTWSDISAVLIADGAEPSTYLTARDVCREERLPLRRRAHVADQCQEKP